ncbi:BhlA/UviB family holin-like peptide [Paraclostridium ghonii]|uniref:Bacteriocin UviB n=1 Tax=Paraclostridium ghonii TaxID=29358 RepID=A0ABU0N459_9FIRM|nr:BhlA/UviB family holin-like peptide [Paeniclostridium ghonii]MCM0165540.1 hypothetical protein [Paeniclostridium ghonii]MDQ0557953.1 hypothetical protein [Paeniclostridium ghonii]
MSNELFEMASTQGVWAILSVSLIFYILKAQEKRDEIQEKREEKYQRIIENMTDRLEVLTHLSDDVNEIKSKLNKAID